MQIIRIKCCVIQKCAYLCHESSPKFDLPRIMKRVTYSLLALTLALTSCSTEELVETQSPIEFTIDLNLAQETDTQMARVTISFSFGIDTNHPFSLIIFSARISWAWGSPWIKYVCFEDLELIPGYKWISFKPTSDAERYVFSF